MSNKKVCGARKKSGGNCRRSPMPNGRCRLHGGLSLAGANSPQFKHGRYSKYLPANLQERASEFLKCRGLFDARDDLALLQMRLSSLLENTAGADFWDLASAQVAELKKALEENDAPKRQKIMAKIDELFTRGLEDAQAWEEIYQLQNLMTKVRDSNTRRESLKSQTITTVEAQALISSVVAAVKDHVSDQVTLANIAREFRRIQSAGGIDSENHHAHLTSH